MSEKSDGWRERGLGDIFSGDGAAVDLAAGEDSFVRIESMVGNPIETSWIEDLSGFAPSDVEVVDYLLDGADKIREFFDLDNHPGVEEIEITDANSTSIADDIAAVLAKTTDTPDDGSPESDIFSDDLAVILGENPNSIPAQSKNDNPAKRSLLGLKISDLLKG